MPNDPKDWKTAYGKRGTQEKPDAFLQQKIANVEAKEMDRDDELKDLEHKAKKVELQQKIDKAQTPPAPQPQESPVSIKFKGDFDINKDRERLEQELQRSRTEDQNTIKSLVVDNEKMKQDIINNNINSLKEYFKSEMDKINAVQSVKNSKTDEFLSEIEKMKSIVSALGMAGASQSVVSDASVQLELKKLDLTQALELRRFDEEAKKRNFDMELALEELKDKREARKAEIERLAKRDELFSKAPETVGKFIGQAIAESARGGGAAAEPGAETIMQQPQPIQPISTNHIDAGIGEFGEVDCTQCGATKSIAVGPSATIAVCGSCRTVYPIKRKQPEPQPTAQPPAEQQPATNQPPPIEQPSQDIPEEEQ